MKSLVSRVCAMSLVFMWSTALSAADIDLSVAADYSGFFFHDVSNLQSIEGRLAVGGSLSVHGTGIGRRVPQTSTQPSLVVAGDILAFDSGTVWAGDQHASYGTYLGEKAAGVPSYLDLRKASDLPFDFDAERDYLSYLSWQLKNMEPTGTVTKQISTVTLTGSNQSVEVFNVPDGYLISSFNIVLQNVSSSSHIILNVASDSTRTAKLGISMTVFQGRHQRVLFNYYDTEVLNLTNIQVWGSILAPYACVCNSNGNIEGTIIADKWNSSMAIGYTPFVAAK